MKVNIFLILFFLLPALAFSTEPQKKKQDEQERPPCASELLYSTNISNLSRQDCQKECDKKNAWGCAYLGVLEHSEYQIAKFDKKGSSNRLTENLKKAKVYSRIACDLKNTFGCENLNYIMYDIASEIEFSWKKKNCSKLSNKKCTLPLREKAKIKKIRKQGKSYLIKACKMKRSSGCYSLGFTKKFEANNIKRRKYLKMACELKHQGGCQMFASFAEKNNDIPLARKYYSIACDLGNSFSCINLAKLERKNKNIKTSRKAFTKACNLMDGKGCNLLGKFEESLKNKNRALKHYRTSCDSMKYGRGCKNVARLEKQKGNKQTATKYFQMACDLMSPDFNLDLDMELGSWVKLMNVPASNGKFILKSYIYDKNDIKGCHFKNKK